MPGQDPKPRPNPNLSLVTTLGSTTAIPVTLPAQTPIYSSSSTSNGFIQSTYGSGTLIAELEMLKERLEALETDLATCLIELRYHKKRADILEQLQ